MWIIFISTMLVWVQNLPEKPGQAVALPTCADVLQQQIKCSGQLAIRCCMPNSQRNATVQPPCGYLGGEQHKCQVVGWKQTYHWMINCKKKVDLWGGKGLAKQLKNDTLVPLNIHFLLTVKSSVWWPLCSRVMLSRQCMYWPCQRGYLFNLFGKASTYTACSVSLCYILLCQISVFRTPGTVSTVGVLTTMQLLYNTESPHHEDSHSFFHPSLWIGNCHSHQGALFNLLALIYGRNTAPVQTVLAQSATITSAFFTRPVGEMAYCSSSCHNFSSITWPNF